MSVSSPSLAKAIVAPATRGPTLWHRWRDSARHMARPALVFAALHLTLDIPAAISEGRHDVSVMLHASINAGLAAGCLLAFVSLADALVTDRRKRTLALAVGAAAAALVAACVTLYALLALVWGGTSRWSVPVLLWGNLGRDLVLFVVATLVYAFREDARRRAKVLDDLRRRRATVLRETAQADLAALQARVEPRFLFDALAAADAMQDVDPAGASALLDDLIAYLRAALPDLATNGSTLGRELDLARAYLAIRRALWSGRFAFALDAPAALSDASFPPMTIVPLLEALLAPAAGADAVAVRVDARRERSAILVLLRVSATTDEPVSRAAIDAVAARLAGPYGGAARVDLRPGRDACELMLEVPDVPESRHR